MKNVIVLIVFGAIFTIGVFGQDVKPTPPAGEEVVKISTDLIQVDVTVTDKNGKVV